MPLFAEQKPAAYVAQKPKDGELARESGARFENTLFVASRSDMYIVSLQQTACSALSRGFEPCSATGS